MPNLRTMLTESDPAVLDAIAEVWKVSLKQVAQSEHIALLHQTMLDPQRADAIWDALDERARVTLQAVISSKKHQMPKAFYDRLYGAFNKMGAVRIAKDKPHLKPPTTSDALYYRGLIAEAHIENAKKGIETVVYVPDDLVAVLPLHRTMYETLDSDEELALADVGDTEEAPVDIPALEDNAVQNIHIADTSIIDDMTTLLAFLRLYSAGVEGDTFLPVETERILPYLLKPDTERLTFMLCVGVGAELIEVREGRAHTRRDGLQRWFALPRWGQLRLLATAWRTTHIYQELWHVPGLYPDADAFGYDATLAREALLEFVAKLPPAKAWWDVASFIEAIKESDADFQRPNGDYESWYIRNDRNEYLRGFDTWDAVEGALIEFLLMAPLHWLGLLDYADDAARLNVYGRGFLGLEPFPQPPDPDERVSVREDGTAVASRKVPRADRFTLARFATWIPNAEPFTYRIEARSIERAIRDQGITAVQIETFLKKQLGDKPLPLAITRLLAFAQSGAVGEVSIERLLVLRTLTSDVLDELFNDPQFRRYLGTRLGPMACVVLNDTHDDFRHKLEQHGIRVALTG